MKSMFFSAIFPDGTDGAIRAIRVLLVDDHRLMRQGLVSLLEDEPDIKVVGEAENGLQAVDLVRKRKPDVVVMDVTMPVMNGLEATERISREWPRTRIIGLSVHRRADMAKAMEDAGAQVYLTKDGPAEDLIAAIRGEEQPGSKLKW